MTGYSRCKVVSFVDRLNEVLNPHGDSPANVLLFLWMVESELRPAIVDNTAFMGHQEAVWRFNRTLSTWEKANVLYELAKQVGPVVTGMAKRFSTNARREDGEYDGR
jgi:hypothetical protein